MHLQSRKFGQHGCTSAVSTSKDGKLVSVGALRSPTTVWYPRPRFPPVTKATEPFPNRFEGCGTGKLVSVGYVPSLMVVCVKGRQFLCEGAKGGCGYIQALTVH